MEQSVKVSVVVPIYNIKPYVRKCVDSVLGQTYTNLEVILVDDGSQDGCSIICDEYKKTDSRIKVIHKTNGGLSDARNAGLSILTGEYVAFIDGDDYYEIDAIEKMVDVAIRLKCSIVKMKFSLVCPDYSCKKNESKNTMLEKIYSSEEYICGMCEKKLSESVCDKLFNASLLKERRFEKGRLNEDFFFLSKMLFSPISIAEIDYAGYNYYQRPGSITNSGYGKSLIDSVKNAYDLKVLAHTEAPALEKYFSRLVLFQSRTVFIVIPWENVRSNSQDYLDTLFYLRECVEYNKKSTLRLQDKIIIELINVCPKLVIYILTTIWKIRK